MSDVKRWRLWNDNIVPLDWDYKGKAREQEPTGGPYVLASDYDAIRNALATLVKFRDQAGRGELTHENFDEWNPKVDAAWDVARVLLRD